MGREETMEVYGFSSAINPFRPQHPAKSISEIAQQIAMMTPIGAKIKAIVIVPSATEGWSMLNNKYPENTLILVGMVIPAIQKLRGSSAEQAPLRSLLGVGGRLGFCPSNSSSYTEVEWTY